MCPVDERTEMVLVKINTSKDNIQLDVLEMWFHILSDKGLNFDTYEFQYEFYRLIFTKIMKIVIIFSRVFVI